MDSLSALHYVGGTTPGVDTLAIRAYHLSTSENPEDVVLGPETSIRIVTGDGPIDSAGNTLQTGRSTSMGGTAVELEEYSGLGDSDDYFRFHLAGPGTAQFDLMGMSEDLDLDLLDSAGAMLGTSRHRGAAREQIRADLSAGDYAVRVYAHSGAQSCYTLATAGF